MNKADLDRYSDAKSRINATIDNTMRLQQSPVNVMWQDIRAIVNGIYQHNKKTPNYLGELLREYAQGYFNAIVKGETVFLYCVDGQFYKLGISDQADLDFPCWDQLPRTMWDSLGDKGGIYWRKTLRPYSVSNKKEG